MDIDNILKKPISQTKSQKSNNPNWVECVENLQNQIDELKSDFQQILKQINEIVANNSQNQNQNIQSKQLNNLQVQGYDLMTRSNLHSNKFVELSERHNNISGKVEKHEKEITEVKEKVDNIEKGNLNQNFSFILKQFVSTSKFDKMKQQNDIIDKISQNSENLAKIILRIQKIVFHPFLSRKEEELLESWCGMEKKKVLFDSYLFVFNFHGFVCDFIKEISVM